MLVPASQTGYWQVLAAEGVALAGEVTKLIGGVPKKEKQIAASKLVEAELQYETALLLAKPKPSPLSPVLVLALVGGLVFALGVAR